MNGMLGNRWSGTWFTLAVCTWPKEKKWHECALLFTQPEPRPMGAQKTYVKPLVMP